MTAPLRRELLAHELRRLDAILPFAYDLFEQIDGQSSMPSSIPAKNEDLDLNET